MAVDNKPRGRRQIVRYPAARGRRVPGGVSVFLRKDERSHAGVSLLFDLARGGHAHAVSVEKQLRHHPRVAGRLPTAIGHFIWQVDGRKIQLIHQVAYEVGQVVSRQPLPQGGTSETSDPDCRPWSLCSLVSRGSSAHIIMGMQASFPPTGSWRSLWALLPTILLLTSNNLPFSRARCVARIEQSAQLG